MKRLWIWLVSPAMAGVIGIVGLALAIYSAFFYERRPDVSVSVDAMSKVFDLHRPIGGLEVSYAGENLRSSKKNLWVLTATVKNAGNAEVRKGDYDEKAPLGLEIGGAVIAERPTLKTGVAYLEKNLSVSTNEGHVWFSPVILEPGDSFEVTVLLLGSESSKPSVMPIGKLAGIKSISLLTPESPAPSKTLIRQAVDATSGWVHPIRWVIYFLGTFVVAAIVGVILMIVRAPLEGFNNRREISERQRRVQEYRQYEELPKESRYLIDLYVTEGKAGLVPVARYMRAYGVRRKLLEAISGNVDEHEVEHLVRNTKAHRYGERRVEEQLKAAKLAEGDGVRVTVASGLESALGDLCHFLKFDLSELISGDYSATTMMSMELDELQKIQGLTRGNLLRASKTLVVESSAAKEKDGGFQTKS